MAEGDDVGGATARSVPDPKPKERDPFEARRDEWRQAARRNPDLTARGFRAADFIADHAGIRAVGHTFFKHSTIASGTGMNVIAVRRAIESAEKADVLRVQRRGVEESNAYWPVLGSRPLGPFKEGRLVGEFPIELALPKPQRPGSRLITSDQPPPNKGDHKRSTGVGAGDHPGRSRAIDRDDHRRSTISESEPLNRSPILTTEPSSSERNETVAEDEDQKVVTEIAELLGEHPLPPKKRKLWRQDLEDFRKRGTQPRHVLVAVLFAFLTASEKKQALGPTTTLRRFEKPAEKWAARPDCDYWLAHCREAAAPILAARTPPAGQGSQHETSVAPAPSSGGRGTTPPEASPSRNAVPVGDRVVQSQDATAQRKLVDAGIATGSDQRPVDTRPERSAGEIGTGRRPISSRAPTLSSGGDRPRPPEASAGRNALAVGERVTGGSRSPPPVEAAPTQLGGDGPRPPIPVADRYRFPSSPAPTPKVRSRPATAPRGKPARPRDALGIGKLHQGTPIGQQADELLLTRDELLNRNIDEALAVHGRSLTSQDDRRWVAQALVGADARDFEREILPCLQSLAALCNSDERKLEQQWRIMKKKALSLLVDRWLKAREDVE